VAENIFAENNLPPPQKKLGLRHWVEIKKFKEHEV
jgi:hypothetical protein